MALNNLSLRFKLLGIIFGGLLAVSIAAGSVFVVISTKQEQQVSQSLLPMAKNLADSIAAQFYERYADVQAFASNRGLNSKDKSLWVEILNDYILLYQIYDSLLIVDMKGRFLAANTVSPSNSQLDASRLESQDFSQTEWFLKAKNKEFSQNSEKGFLGTYVTDVEIDPVSSSHYGKDMYGNSFTSVIKNAKGQGIAVITARAGFRWVEYEFKNYYKALSELNYTKAELTLLNNKGQIIVDYDPAVTGSTDVKHNFENVLLKLNLAENGVKAAQDLVSGKSGSITSFHARKKINQISGYTRINSEKFLDKVLGWGVLIRVPQDEVLADIYYARTLFFTLIGIALLAGIIVVFLYSRHLINSLDNLANKLRDGSSTVAKTSTQIALSSQDLSEATNNQASSLQQTVASIAEISAMVKTNTETAAHSKNLAEHTEESALQGKQSLDRLIAKINDIGTSNQRIQDQMQKSNEEISNIVKVISAISDKTKVINDIVFQTKLLSFNASVEAQRAGEHGKGFSVVAEEVGKLAQMSGTASSEINVLIENSMTEVENIVNSTNSSIGKLVEESRIIVKDGQELAEECSDVLDGVVSNVKDVNEKMTQISTASSEQDTGISEVTEAMNRLDGVTHQNSDVAHKTSENVKVLDNETQVVRQVVIELSELVHGKNTTTANSKDTNKSQAKVHMLKKEQKTLDEDYDNDDFDLAS